MKHFYLIIRNGYQNVEGRVLKYLDHEYLERQLNRFKNNDIDFILNKLPLKNGGRKRITEYYVNRNKKIFLYSINKNNQVKQLKSL